MFRNNLKIILRTLRKQKSFTIIHVLGLSLGLACCLFIYLFITHELSFDGYHSKANHIYRVNETTTNYSGTEHSGGTPFPLAEALRLDIPELETVAKIYIQSNGIVRTPEQVYFKLEEIIFAEAGFIDLFDFSILDGEAQGILDVPNQAIISQSMAKNIFGDQNPIGQTINLDNIADLRIGAVMADSPYNTHLPAQLLVSFQSLTSEAIGGFPLDNWNVSIGGVTYVGVSNNNQVATINKSLSVLSKKYYTGDDYDGERKVLSLQPLSDIHFNTEVRNVGPTAPVESIYLWFFGAIGLFVLAIACFNFINLSTVQAIKRANEVGVRKVLGAEKKDLIGQFLGEALIIAFIAGIMAAAIVQLFLPTVNGILNKQIDLSLMHSAHVGLFLLITVVLVGLLSGLYPAFGLASYEPAKVLKSKNTAGNRQSLLLRHSLVVAQFTITLVLMIGTLAISQQVNYLKNKDLGFSQEAILLTSMPERKNFDLLRNEWSNNPQVQKVSFGIGPPTSNNNINTSIHPKGAPENQQYSIALKTVDTEYMDTYQIQLQAGRWITKSEERQAATNIPNEERAYQFVVNEAFVKKMGYANPKDILGKRFELGVNDIEAEVIGVTKDFNIASLHKAIKPTVLMNYPDLYYSAGIKIATNDISATIAHIEKVWKKQFPKEFFEYKFLDENISQLYDSETRLFHLFQVSAGMAILIGCMGLWGLISFITEQRTKEIGIRKVLGASVGNIVGLLSKDFIKLVLIAGVISVPFAWYGMNHWLTHFQYRIETPWEMFVLAIATLTAISLLTTSIQSIRAAWANPAKSLKSE